MKIRLLLAALVSFVLVGCAGSSHVLTGTVRPAIDIADVKIHSKPPAEYEEIAILHATSKDSWSFTDQGEMDVVVRRLKEEAASLGANGILLKGFGVKGETVGQYSGGYGFVVTEEHKSGEAIAIHVP